MLELARNEMLRKQSDISATLADLNQHYAERIKVELLETLDVFWKMNAAALPIDKVNLYRNWLTGFSQRRMEDVSYAMEAAQVLSSTEMKRSMGLVENEDLEAAKAAE